MAPERDTGEPGPIYKQRPLLTMAAGSRVGVQTQGCLTVQVFQRKARYRFTFETQLKILATNPKNFKSSAWIPTVEKQHTLWANGSLEDVSLRHYD